MIIPRTITVQPTWFKFTKTFADFAAAKLTNSIELFTLPDGCLLHAVSVDLVTAFSDGALATYSLSIGPAGDATKYVNAFNAVSDASSGQVQYATIANETYKGEQVVNIGLTAVGANLDQAIVGEISVYSLISKMT